MGRWTCYDAPFRIADPDPEPGPVDDPEALAADIAPSINAAAFSGEEAGAPTADAFHPDYGRDGD